MASAAASPADVRSSLIKQVYINGAWVDTPSHFEVLDPSTGELLAVAGSATAAQADEAVKAAAAAWQDWKKLSDAEHAKWLYKLADEVAARRSRIATAEALNTGKPLREAEGDIDDVIGALRYSAKLGESGSVKAIQTNTAALPDPSFTARIEYEPVGVVVGITPFNFPAMMASWKIGPALAAGCVVIIKPSEFTPFTALELAAAAHAIGLPRGVLQVLTGDGALGNALVVHPQTDKVSFTGSGATGVKVMKAAADGVKRVTLELGGKSPLLVCDDADLDAAVEWIIFGAFFNCGQICSATSRVLLQAGIAEEATKRIVAAAARLKQGTSFEPDVDIGPSCNAMQWSKVRHYIATTVAEGATLLLGGDRPAGARFEKGFWTSPTVFGGVTAAHTVWREEVFGPVLTLSTFRSLEEGIAMANDTEYGLAAAVFSRDDATLRRCAREVRAGVVWTNNAQPSPHAQPWGGFKKSGIGRELGPLALLPFLEAKAVTGWTAGRVGWYSWYGTPAAATS